MKEMLVPGQMLRKHPVGQLLTEDDHLVSWQSSSILWHANLLSGQHAEHYSITAAA
jgi:hypothetical protein